MYVCETKDFTICTMFKAVRTHKIIKIKPNSAIKYVFLVAFIFSILLQLFRVFAALLHGTLVVGVSQTLRR